MTDALVEGDNPIGNIHASVETDGRSCYFYLCGAPETEFGVKSVWVRNLVPAPEVLDVNAMRDGEPPLNPLANCRDCAGSRVPRVEDLHIVWLPEGNGAALYECDDLLAIIPPWSGEGGFHGYSRDCAGEGPLAWELTPDNVLIDRFAAATDFWNAWAESEPWPRIQDQLIARIEAALGPHANYYAIDGGAWPPKAVLRIPVDDKVALVTVGVSILPQPNVEKYVSDPQPLRRIELGVVVPANWPDDAIKRFASYLSGQSRLPWNRYTWLGGGHTIPCDSWRSSRFSAALLVKVHPAVKPFDVGLQFGDPVSILWFLPISAAERDIAIAQGSEALLTRLPLTRWHEA